MNNTMLAEQQTTTDNRPFPDDEIVPLRVTSSVAARRKAKQKAGLFRGDWATVAVLIACSTMLGTIGVVYVAAFARVSMQSIQISAMDSQLMQAQAEHEALIKQEAFLESDNRIAPRALAMKMSQAGPSIFVDVIPTQPSSQRQVASAL